MFTELARLSHRLRRHRYLYRLFKRFVILFGSYLVLVSAVVLLALWLLLQQQERQAQQAAHDLFLTTLTEGIQDLQLIVDDWSRWTDMYHFVTGSNPNFPASYFTRNTLNDTQTFLMAVIEPAESQQWLALSVKEPHFAATTAISLVQSGLAQQQTRGLLCYQEHCYFYAVNPIFDTLLQQQSEAMLLMMRRLSPDFFNLQNALTHSLVLMEYLPQVHTQGLVLTEQDIRRMVPVHTNNATHLRTELHHAEGRLFTFVLLQSRELKKELGRVLNWLFIGFAVLTLLLMWLLYRLVVKHIARPVQIYLRNLLKIRHLSFEQLKYQPWHSLHRAEKHSIYTMNKMATRQLMTEKIIESIGEPIFLLDHQNAIIHANSCARQLLLQAPPEQQDLAVKQAQATLQVPSEWQGSLLEQQITLIRSADRSLSQVLKSSALFNTHEIAEVTFICRSDVTKTYQAQLAVYPFTMPGRIRGTVVILSRLSLKTAAAEASSEAEEIPVHESVPE